VKAGFFMARYQVLHLTGVSGFIKPQSIETTALNWS
jgi:hypothetical protein